MDETDHFPPQFRQFPLAERIVPHIRTLKVVIQPACFVHCINQIPAGHPLSLPGIIVDISRFVRSDDAFLPDRYTAVGVICRQRALLDLIGGDMLYLQ